jgi:hypothetical protein
MFEIFFPAAVISRISCYRFSMSGKACALAPRTSDAIWSRIPDSGKLAEFYA